MKSFTHKTYTLTLIAAVAVGGLTGCSSSPEISDASPNAPVTQSEQPTTVPTNVEPTAPAIDHYNVSMIDVRGDSFLFVKVVEQVMSDGSIMPADNFHRSLVITAAGAQAPTSGQCGADVAHQGTKDVVAELFGHPGMTWDASQRESIVPTFVFEADPDGLDNPVSDPASVILTHEGVELGEILVERGYAYDAGLDTPSYATQEAQARAAGLGIWAQCEG